MVDIVQRYKPLLFFIKLSPNSFVCFRRNYEFTYALAEIKEAFFGISLGGIITEQYITFQTG